MVQLIVGNKGKGKTKHLLDVANSQVKNASGNIVYLDKSKKHMFELNNKIRLIDVPSYLVSDKDEFVGFVCGIISQDHDLQQMYFDGFLKIACITEEEAEAVITRLEVISNKFEIDFIISISIDEADLPASLKDKIVISL